MRVAPHRDGRTLGQAQIALAQLNALALGQLHQLLDRAMGEPGVGRMRDRLLLEAECAHRSGQTFADPLPSGGGIERAPRDAKFGDPIEAQLQMRDR